MYIWWTDWGGIPSGKHRLDKSLEARKSLLCRGMLHTQYCG